MAMHLDLRRVPSALLAIGCLGLLGCHSDKPKPTRVVAASPLPQYWLAHAALSERPGGAAHIHVEQPTLIELSPNGRVRGVSPQARAIEGFLVEDVRREPGRHGGLMLYAQRESELYWRRPDGPLLGRLHPGAFVSVAAEGKGRVQIGALPFDQGAERVIAYVDRAALGIEPHVPSPARATGAFDALQMPGTVGWRDDPAGSTHAAWQSLPCRDVWLSVDRSTIAQSVEGVELLGNGHDLSALGYNPVALYETLTCPAHTAPTNNTPKGYRLLALPEPDPLPAAIEQRKTLYWLLATVAGPRCDAWQFAPSRAQAGHGRSGFLLRAERVPVDSGKTSRARLPFDYSERDGNKPAMLHFGTLELDGKIGMKCECNYHYALLSADDGELGVSGHPLPSDFSAYDPGELERWFLSADRCEAALREVVATLARDGTTATRLGFHAQIVAWGL